MKKVVPDPPVLPTSPRRYMPLTSNDCTIPALLADTEAPLDVLHEAASHRIRAATQLLENIASIDDQGLQALSLAVISQCLGGSHQIRRSD